MAAFYKYIKGYMSDGETTQYIFFNQAKTGEQSIKDNRPYFSSINDFSGTDNADTKHFFVSEDGNHTFTGQNNFNGKTIFTSDIIPDFQKGLKVSNFIETGSTPFSIQDFQGNSLLSFSDNKATFKNEVVSEVSVTARYFNALSDRHLKTNINTIEDSVLPFITSTPVYTFNYKKDPTIPVIGIMAQDVLDKNINDFNLVKKNGNGYYEIKESKMIYILWKAVQEQQKQIEALQARLEGEVNGEAND